MPLSSRSRPRRRSQTVRRLALFLARLGATSERVAVLGMIAGGLAGAAFFATGELPEPAIGWVAAAGLCLARLLAIRVSAILQPASTRQSREEEFYNELPERVSDAVTVIGFGFALGSSPWLGLGAALAAIFSAYVRSFAFARSGGREGGVVLMNRVQRLALLSAAAILMASGVSPRFSSPTLPVLALWVILVGCLLTVGIRWIGLRAIRV